MFYVIRETRFKQHRTPCGAWSRVRFDESEFYLTPAQHRNATGDDWARFLNAHRTRCYTELGYIVTRFTSISPSGTIRSVLHCA